MKSGLTLFVLISGALVMRGHAGTKRPYQTATVISVANHQVPSRYVSNPTDAPVESEVYSYDIGIQLDCTLYLVRYETGLDYLPSVFSPHQTVEVSVQEHVMNVNLPGVREVRLSIGRRSRVKGASCSVNN